MKFKITLLFILTAFVATAQQTEFTLQGRTTDSAQKPVADVYIVNIRNSGKSISTSNGIFELRVIPSDTLIVSHISFLRKVVSVYELLINPTVVLETDTVNIKPVNVSGDRQTDYDAAMKNISSIKLDPRSLSSDEFSTVERTKELMKTENRVLRTEASSVSIYRFSPSEVLGKWAEKRKKRKEAYQYDSTKKLTEEE
jgi:biopolymer transport protein ExbD